MSDNGFYPSGFISLRKAIQRVAAAMGEPISDSDFDRLERYWSADRKARSSGFVREDILEITRDKTIEPLKCRYKKAADQFRRIAHGESLTAEINADGVLEQLSSFWGKPAAGQMLEEGTDIWTDEYGRFGGGPVLVKEDRLATVLEPNQPPKGFPSYVPPFIDYMLRGVSELALSDRPRIPKDNVKRWLRENWAEDELGRMTKNMIEKMATMMRPPEARRGGNTPWKGDTQGPEPPKPQRKGATH